MRQIGFIPVLLLLLVAGCSQSAPPQPDDLCNPDSAVKIQAMRKMVTDGCKDPALWRQVAEELDNDDPAVRLYAYMTLRQLTHKTFEYRYYDSQKERKPAVDAWKQWLAQQEKNPASKDHGAEVAEPQATSPAAARGGPGPGKTGG